MTHLVHLADRVLNTPLMITPEKAQVIFQVLAGRINVNSLVANQFVGDDGVYDDDQELVSLKPYRVADGVAIVTILGSLVNRGAWVGARSGLTSYEGIQHQLSSARSDTDVRSVILDLNTPGGEVAGAMETAAAVRALAAEKRVVALVNGQAASAGYAIASGANEIVTTEAGVTGSIGVLHMHADISESLAEEGVKVTLTHAGAHKVDANPFEPLSDSVRADLQAQVNGIYDLFVEAVAMGRGGRLSAAAARATEARLFVGAAAVPAGLADRVGTFDSIFSELRTAPALGGAIDQERTIAMTSVTTSVPTVQTPAGEDALASARADGVAAGREEVAAEMHVNIDAAVTAERERVTGILEAADGAHAATARHLIQSGASLEVAQGVFATLPQESTALAQIRDADADATGATAAPIIPTSKVSEPAPKTPEGWRAEWDATPNLRAEFPDAEDYVAYKKRAA